MQYTGHKWFTNLNFYTVNCQNLILNNSEYHKLIQNIHYKIPCISRHTMEYVLNAKLLMQPFRLFFKLNIFA